MTGPAPMPAEITGAATLRGRAAADRPPAIARARPQHRTSRSVARRVTPLPNERGSRSRLLRQRKPSASREFAESPWRLRHARTCRKAPQDVAGASRVSYDALDNGGLASAEQIRPELQQIEVGDLMAWTPRARDGFFVAEIDPGRSLVLTGDAGLYRVVCAFVLEPIDANRTRLLARASGDWDRRAVWLLLQLVWRPMHFAMERKQLLNLRRRSEGARRDPRGGERGI